jgi:hypothetical protein
MGEADLRTLSYICAGLGAVAALVVNLSGPADAKSCTERLKTCQGFCVKTESGSPGRLAKCGEYRQACLGSGCWESKYVSKECGFAKQ